jgi:hypothetical protein
MREISQYCEKVEGGGNYPLTPLTPTEKGRHPMTTSQEQVLLDDLGRVFGPKQFDTTSVIAKADWDEELASAIDAALPGYIKNTLHARYRRLGRLLNALADDHFTTDDAGWWYLNGSEGLGEGPR